MLLPQIKAKSLLKAAPLLPITMYTFKHKRLTLPQLKIAEKQHDFYAGENRLNEFRGIGFTIGSRAQQHDYQDMEITQSDARATIGSLGGDVTFVAGEQATILGTDVIAQAIKRLISLQNR
ncbi:hypothetical protein INT80_10495 [Gallibacterium anatis]|uniref:Uncharacterized protein n=1 Tax=Gallibacterium anatis TaxID=750 RepID=A0A930URU5_9PAST|nr:hypothetical protein [Gallibacterium anatis]